MLRTRNRVTDQKTSCARRPCSPFRPPKPSLIAQECPPPLGRLDGVEREVEVDHVPWALCHALHRAQLFEAYSQYPLLETVMVVDLSRVNKVKGSMRFADVSEVALDPERLEAPARSLGGPGHAGPSPWRPARCTGLQQT